MTTNYISGRIEKCKITALETVNTHNLRLDSTDSLIRCGANSHQNKCYHGDLSIKDAVNKRLKECNIKLTNGGSAKTQSVAFCEVVVNASPTFFRKNQHDYGVYDPELTDKWAKEVTKYLKKKYGANLVRVDLHVDEATPHIHAVFTPIVEKIQNKRRTKAQIAANESAGTFKTHKLHAFSFTKKAKLIALQDELAEEVGVKFNLKRGVKGSAATHMEARKYWGMLNEMIESNKFTLKDFKAKAIKLKNKPLLTSFPVYKEGEEKRINKSIVKKLKEAAKKIENYKLQAVYFKELYEKERARTAIVSDALLDSENIADFIEKTNEKIVGLDEENKQEINQLLNQYKKMVKKVEITVENKISEYKLELASKDKSIGELSDELKSERENNTELKKRNIYLKHKLNDSQNSHDM